MIVSERSRELEVVDVVVRCRNEMPFTERTLAALASQRAPRARVLFIDCDSTDGSREAAVSAGARVIDLAPKAYIPGKVLNAGMEMTQSEVVAFVNADAIPLDDGALGRLVAPLLGEGKVAATFGKQVARPDADPLTKVDYARAFGDRPVQTRRGAFFSMAASAIRRDVWEALPFDESYAKKPAYTAMLNAITASTRTGTPPDTTAPSVPTSGTACVPRSSTSSRTMLRRLPGRGRTPGATENESPTAWPGVG